MASRGHAGRAFIRHLIKRGVLNNARMAMESELAELVERSGLIEPRPWLRALAACHVAGTLGRDIGLLEYEPRRITDWTLKEMLK